MEDVCRGIADLVAAPEAEGKIVNIGSDAPVTILELAERIIALVNRKLDIEFESLRRIEPHLAEEVRQAVPDLARLRALVPFEPQYDLDAALRQAIEWRRNHLHQQKLNG